MNWLAAVVLIILLVSALRGYKVGFIKTAFSLLSVIIALVVSTIISPWMSKVLRENENFVKGINAQLEAIIVLEDKDIDKASEETGFIEDLSLPKMIKDSLIENNNVEVYKAMAVNSFKEYLINAISVMVINTIAYAICFVGIFILLFVLSRVLDIISKLPLLNEVNKISGLAVGVLMGCIKVWIFFLVVTSFSTSPFGESIFEMINESPILSFIYNNNLLMNGIVNITKSIF